MENVKFEIGKAYALTMTENGSFIWREAATGETGYQCKPCNLNAVQLAAYKQAAEQIKGYPVRFTHSVNGKPTTIETTLRGVSYDKTNNRATFATASGRAVATFHRFTVLAEVAQPAATTEVDNRPAAMIRADIQAVTDRIGKLQSKLATLREALAAAQVEDLKAVAAVIKLVDWHTLDNVHTLLIGAHDLDVTPNWADKLTAFRVLSGAMGASTAAGTLDLTPEAVDVFAEASLNEASVNTLIGKARTVARVIAERGLRVDDIDFAALPYPTGQADQADQADQAGQADQGQTAE